MVHINQVKNKPRDEEEKAQNENWPNNTWIKNMKNTFSLRYVVPFTESIGKKSKVKYQLVPS